MILGGKMKKGEFRFKNLYNMTTDEIKGKPVNIEFAGYIQLVGILTHIENDYVYGVFNHNGEYNFMIDLNNEKYALSFHYKN